MLRRNMGSAFWNAVEKALTLITFLFNAKYIVHMYKHSSSPPSRNIVRLYHFKLELIPLLTQVKAGQSASFALKKVKRTDIRKGMVLVSTASQPKVLPKM